jgi:hypothetical protein
MSDFRKGMNVHIFRAKEDGSGDFDTVAALTVESVDRRTLALTFVQPLPPDLRAGDFIGEAVPPPLPEAVTIVLGLERR